MEMDELPIPKFQIPNSRFQPIESELGILNLEFWNIESELGILNLEFWHIESGILIRLFQLSSQGVNLMRYKRFEELPVWNQAIELAVQVYELTSKSEFASRYSLRDQIERAAVSVSNNIAEGFERGTNNELLAFLYIARGSAGEVRSMLCLPRADSGVSIAW